jgi:hypothetical protein
MHGDLVMSDCRTFNGVTPAVFACVKQSSFKDNGTVYDPASGNKGNATTRISVGTVVMSFDFNADAGSITYRVVTKPWIVTYREIFNGIANTISACQG